MKELATSLLPTNYELVYLTHFGSKLYGTDTEKSDTYLKGIFIPSRDDLLLQKASDNFSYTSGDKNSRNSSDDVDIELWSISKFFRLLAKGETGAIDLLFSMFRDDTIVYEDSPFTKRIKDNYSIFLSKNFKTFIGYCMGQTHKYGIKGSRFHELVLIKTWFDEYMKITNNVNIDGVSTSNFFDSIEEKISKLKFSKIVDTDKGRYFSILGKMHHDRISLELFHKQLMNQYNSYGERTKKALEGIDYKALSHAIRVLYEMEELVNTKFIKFPLEHSDFIKAVKYNDLYITLEELFEIINQHIEDVQDMIDKSYLPSKINQKEIDELHLTILHYYYH